MSELVLMLPNTSTVLLTDSGCTMTRKPLASVNEVGWTDDLGNVSFANAVCAQSGSVTAPLGLPPKLSAPPNLLCEIALPEDCGVRIAVIACAGLKIRFAIAFTSAGVTAAMAARKSSGEWKLPLASAEDQALARPDT